MRTGGGRGRNLPRIPRKGIFYIDLHYRSSFLPSLLMVSTTTSLINPCQNVLRSWAQKGGFSPQEIHFSIFKTGERNQEKDKSSDPRLSPHL